MNLSRAADAIRENINRPYLHLRERPLKYYGLDKSLTHSEVRIGWFGPHQGTNYETDPWLAASLACEEFNTTRPTNTLPVRLIPCWSVDPWGTGVSQLARLVYTHDLAALLGSVDSPSTHLAEQLAAKANLPLLSPFTTDKTATLAGVPWMFCAGPSDAAIARVLAHAVLSASGNSQAPFSLLACTDHESRMMAREFSREIASHGRLPDFRFDLPPAAGPWRAQFDALTLVKPQYLVIIASAEVSARLVLESRKAFPSAAIFCAQFAGRAAFRELAGAAAEGVRYPLLCRDAEGKTGAAFVKKFRCARGRAPDYAVLLTYDSTCLLLERLARSGPSRARLRELLAGGDRWQGIAAPIQFDGTGLNSRTNIPMGAISNGLVVSLN